MIVVSDTSPLCYLFLVGEVELLPALFGTVVIAPAVARELSHPGAEAIRDWVRRPPPWLKVRELEDSSALGFERLDDGERETLRLATELGSDLVLLDDKAAREAASGLGLRVTGTLGVLDVAARRRLVELPSTIARLRRTSFRATPALLEALLSRHREAGPS